MEDPIKLASLYNTLGGVCWQQGNLDKAVSYVEQGLRLHERAGYFWGKAIAYGTALVIFADDGDEEALANLRNQPFGYDYQLKLIRRKKISRLVGVRAKPQI